MIEPFFGFPRSEFDRNDSYILLPRSLLTHFVAVCLISFFSVAVFICHRC